MKYGHECENRSRGLDRKERFGPKRLRANSGTWITAQLAEEVSDPLFGNGIEFAVSIS